MCRVVPRKGDVDRNVDHIGLLAHGDPVVPRKGDVDRNIPDSMSDPKTTGSSPARGTWIEMSYSRVNVFFWRSSPARGTWIEINIPSDKIEAIASSPARGTWIEISQNRSCRCPAGRSSPARGTWIEMFGGDCDGQRPADVVPRKGDVDRNLCVDGYL